MLRMVGPRLDVFLCCLFIAFQTKSIECSDDANDLVFDEPFIDKAIASAELSWIVQNENATYKDGTFSFFETMQAGGNRAIVAKRDGICYAAYASESPGRFEERLERLTGAFTFNFGNFAKVCFDDCCKVRTPIQQNFNALHEEVEPAVELCRETCGESTPCPLVLTGHHQGGAVAYTAGVQFSYANPIGYTFGSPKVFKGGCQALDSTRWYRFVNSMESQHRRDYGIPPGGVIYDFIPLSYDSIPDKPYLFTNHIGYQLTMALDYTIANLGLDANIAFRTTSSGAGEMVIENPDRYQAGYLDRLVYIRDFFTTIAAFPVPNGYYQRDLCTVKEECSAGLDCFKQCPLCPPRCS